jgi:hypothetical protein
MVSGYLHPPEFMDAELSEDTRVGGTGLVDPRSILGVLSRAPSRALLTWLKAHVIQQGGVPSRPVPAGALQHE